MTCTRGIHWRSLLVAAVLALVPAGRGSCEQTAFDLCIDQSPVRAGTVTPNSGTHRFHANAVVALSAEPQPGYQFAYWLGDVADPSARQTTVQVCSPKVIVAVFKSAEKDSFATNLGGGGGGGDLLILAPADLSTPAWSIPGGRKDPTITSPTLHTPEPTTIALLTLGTLALRRNRGRRRSQPSR